MVPPAPLPAGPRDRTASVPLVALTTGLVMVETAVLSALGPVTGLALAPQVSAPSPLDLFHDLRWLAVYTPSWAVFVVAFGALVALRTVATAAIVGWAWPADLPAPRWRARLRQAAVATAIVAAVLVPWVSTTCSSPKRRSGLSLP